MTDCMECDFFKVKLKVKNGVIKYKGAIAGCIQGHLYNDTGNIERLYILNYPNWQKGFKGLRDNACMDFKGE